MAESDSILQLGIEAAREGNKEEARNLFRLLTRQEPQNTQAWLWLAGVAENREERQAALEQVVELDPENEMAVKGLQALGVNPTRRLDQERPAAPVEDDMPPPPAVVAGGPADYDEDDPFAELDSLSETMSQSPEAVRRSGFEPEEVRQPAGVAAYGSAAGDEPDQERRAVPGRSARQRRADYNDMDDNEPARRGISPLLIGLVVLALIILLAVWFWPGEDEGIAQNGNGAAPGVAAVEQTQTAEAAGGVATPTDAAVAGEPTDAAEGVAPGNGGEPTVAPGNGAAPAEPGVPPEGGEPGTEPAGPETPPEGGEPAATPAPAEPAPPADEADPALVAPGTTLQTQGWQYTFSQPAFANAIVGNLGNLQPQNGRFAVVLLFVGNETGQSQTIPPDLFVLKDAQGRVYEARPEASTAYVNRYGRGIAADQSQEEPVPADSLRRSVPIIFDVAPDATDLRLFARTNPDQGWLVLRNV